MGRTAWNKGLPMSEEQKAKLSKIREVLHLQEKVLK